MIQPVCGINYERDHSGKTFMSSCHACSDKAIKFYIPDECESYPVNAEFCDKKENFLPACSLVAEPACGMNSLEFSKEYENNCLAC